MTTPARIHLLIIDRLPSKSERQMAEMVVAQGRIVKNKWGGLTVGEMRLTPTQRLAVEAAIKEAAV